MSWNDIGENLLTHSIYFKKKYSSNKPFKTSSCKYISKKTGLKTHNNMSIYWALFIFIFEELIGNIDVGVIKTKPVKSVEKSAQVV